MMTDPWHNPSLSLGARCVLLAKYEMEQRHTMPPAMPAPNTSPRVQLYLAGCVRDLNHDGVVAPTERLNLKEGNWCAAFTSWCLEQCLLPGEPRPHLYRAGVVELVADAQERGLWRPWQDVFGMGRLGLWTPHVGDLCIWDRSEAGKPETAWWRHVNRVARWEMAPNGVQLTTIGGNEGRHIRMTDQPPKALDRGKLMGFISYYQAPAAQVYMTDEERQRSRGLVAAFVGEMLKEARG